MTQRDDSGLIDLNALLKDVTWSASPPNESPQCHEVACDPLATVPGDLYLLTMRLSAAGSAPAPESVGGSLLPARREGWTRLAITVALAAVLACGGTAIWLTQGGVATYTATTSQPPPEHERAVAPTLAVAERTPCDRAEMPNHTPATMQASTSSRPDPAALARPHRAGVSKAKTDELAKPPSEDAPSNAETARTTEAAPDPTTAAAAAPPSAAPSTEVAPPAEEAPPAPTPRAEVPMTLDEAMRSAVRGKEVQPSPSRQEVARGREGNATDGELQ